MYKCSIIIYGGAINFVTCYQAAYEMLCTQNDFFYNDNFTPNDKEKFWVNAKVCGVIQ